jgi:flagellar FliJ protein
MKRFRFNLEKVLELRKYREHETEIELGRAIGALTTIEKKITAAASEIHSAAGERFLPGNGAAEIIAWDLYITRLDTIKEKLLVEAARAEQFVDEKRGVYLEASRDRKVIGKIKEKRETEYRKTALAEETKVLDDVANSNNARKNKGC